MTRQLPAHLAKIAILGAAYVAVSKLGLMVGAVGGFATLVWPATGMSLIALLEFGSALWPGIALGAFAVNFWAGAPLPVAAAIACGNTLEAVIGAYLVRRVAAGTDELLDRPPAVGGLILVAGVSTAVSASFGAISLLLGGKISPADFYFIWRVWWLGDAISDLIVAPVLVAWTTWRREAWQSKRTIEAIALALTMGLATAGVFFGRRSILTDMALGPYLLFPPLIWAAFRFGPRVVVSLSLLAAIVAICGTALGFGPFAIGSLSERLLPLQAFMTIWSATGLLLGAAVSERRRAEAEAREAVRARDEFLSIASHELKTPLTSLQLQIESLAVKLKAALSLPAALSTKLQTILRQTRRLGELIDNLLDVSRITSRRLDLQLEEVDLAALVKDVAARAEERLAQAGSPLELEVVGPVWGYWDKQRLHQVIDNLLANAIKYGAGKPITISLKASAEAAVLMIRDQGIGIAPEDQARIFQRFVRAVSPQQYGGFGLGLWIARQIVERLGGGIRVTSEPNQGSTFTVALPYHPAQSDCLAAQ
jgi:signal transduction histidine kinase